MSFAFIFNDVGIGEWLVLLAVILVVVGPRRLPETARKFGSVYSKFRRAAESFKRQLLDMDTEFDRTVAEAESEANKAFSMDDESAYGPHEYHDYHDGYDPMAEGDEAAPDDASPDGAAPAEDIASANASSSDTVAPTDAAASSDAVASTDVASSDASVGDAGNISTNGTYKES